MNGLRIGVDFGSSYTDLVALEGTRLVSARSFDSGRAGLFRKLTECIGRWPQPASIALTGGRKSGEFASLVKKSLRGRAEVVSVGEMASIGLGARALSGKRRFLSVNVGTGTPFVYVNGSRFKHVGGTGVGGGALAGLGKLLLGVKIEGIGVLASKGSGALDLTVGEVMGGGLGKIPANATAANFCHAARNSDPNRRDVARSLVRLVAESVGVMSALAAQNSGCGTIVFTGRVAAKNRLVARILGQTVGFYGKKAVFPPNGEYCTAIGAALSAGR